MLTAVKNQIKVTTLSIKYALMRQMINKTTFITNILFMILNNASFLIQWVILFSLKDEVGGYGFKQVLMFWGIAAGTYGISRFFFYKSFSLSDIINEGKLDSYLVQPKNVLISIVTSDVSVSALGDIIYGYIMLIIYGITFENFLLYTLLIICGGLIVSNISILLGSLSFWFSKSDALMDTINTLMVNFATYPDGIFKGITKIILYTIVPVGLSTYIPVKALITFDIKSVLIVLGSTALFICLAFIVFYRGLKKYSSSNLMISKI